MIISVVLVGGLSLLLLFCFLFFAIGYNGTRLSSRNLEAGFMTTVGYPGHQIVAFTGLLVLGLGLVGAASAADVVVKERQLGGSVVGVTIKGVQFQTIYDEGTIVIPWSGVDWEAGPAAMWLPNSLRRLCRPMAPLFQLKGFAFCHLRTDANQLNGPS